MASPLSQTNIKHPDTFAREDGRSQLAKEVEAINQSIRLILTTAKGELFGDPSFGSTLYTYIYDNVGEDFDREIQDVIAQELNEQESRILVKAGDITISHETTKVVIDISYSIKRTDYRSSYQYIKNLQED